MSYFSHLSKSITSKALIAANIIPLIGVIFFGWDLKFILVLYWLENVVLGIFNVIKMLLVNDGTSTPNRLFNTGFFTVHYGGFCAIHGVILFGFLGISLPDTSGSIGGQDTDFILVEVFSLIQPTISHLHHLFGSNFILSFIALFISHGFSLIDNFFAKGERNLLSVKKLFGLPYSRIVVLHVTIILGGMLVQELGSPVPMLALLVCLKILIDLKLHRREHRAIQSNSELKVK